MTIIKTPLLIIIVFFFLSACSSKPNVVNSRNILNKSNQSNTVYITNHGWHTGIVIAQQKIAKILPAVAARFSSASFIEFGWGDKGFYQAQEITTGLTLSAMFWPTDTVIHAVAVSDDIYVDFPSSQIKKLCLNKEQLNSLIRFIFNSFYKNDTLEIVATKKGVYGNSQFYQAEGEYYLMNTCNKWTAKGLKSAGFDLSPFFKLTASSVMDDVLFTMQQSAEQLQSDSCS